MIEPVDCKSVSRWLSDALELELAPEARARLQHHFSVCETCRHVAQQMALLRSAMKRIDAERGEP